MKAVFESDVKFMNVQKSAFVGLADEYGIVYNHMITSY